MASIDEGIVMARQDNMLVTSFHPELTDSPLVHQYFLSMIGDKSSNWSKNQSGACPQVLAVASPRTQF